MISEREQTVIGSVRRYDKEKLAAWMIENHFATGHGDTMDGLLRELTWQVKELRDKISKLEKP